MLLDLLNWPVSRRLYHEGGGWRFVILFLGASAGGTNASSTLRFPTIGKSAPGSSVWLGLGAKGFRVVDFF